MRSLVFAALFSTVALGCDESTAPPSDDREPRVLVFSRTAGFRHASIPAGIAAVEQIAAAAGIGVTATEDPALFTDALLDAYDAVIFLNTTGDVLADSQQAAFERFIQAGGGFVGVHSATDTEYDWAWYGGLVGAYFASHPAIQQGTLTVADGAHPSTESLATPWTRTDEWYNFAAAPAASVQVLITIDEGSYTGGTMGATHPISWYHAYDGGRAWYTAMGHTEASYSEPAFLAHLRGGIFWAAGVSVGGGGS